MSNNYRVRSGHIAEPVITLKLMPTGIKSKFEVVEGIIDTGADTTIVPLAVLRRMLLKPVGQGKLVSQWGDEHLVSFYLMDIEVDSVLLPAIRVAGDESASEPLVGRNIMNKLAVPLDGPVQQTELLDNATLNRLRSRRVQNP
jgi:predicted aspartyl protease